MPKPALTLDPCRIPAHVAVIMDGNGRWAKARGLDRSEGHAEGVNTVHRITQRASDIGVKWLTLYTFSTENWRRPQAEVDALMTLIGYAIERETPGLLENNVRLRVIGDFGRMPEAARRSLQGCMDATAGCTGLNLVLAISYSARWEIAEAARTLARRAAEGKLDPEAITEQTVADALTTAGIPDPDLIIRTGGDRRLSNYLLWQAAYSEIVVTDTFWPDFTADEFCDAIADFQQRERRFGMTSEQIVSSH